MPLQPPQGQTLGGTPEGQAFSPPGDLARVVLSAALERMINDATPVGWRAKCAGTHAGRCAEFQGPRDVSWMSLNQAVALEPVLSVSTMRATAVTVCGVIPKTLP